MKWPLLDPPPPSEGGVFVRQVQFHAYFPARISQTPGGGRGFGQISIKTPYPGRKPHWLHMDFVHKNMKLALTPPDPPQNPIPEAFLGPDGHFLAFRATFLKKNTLFIIFPSKMTFSALFFCFEVPFQP